MKFWLVFDCLQLLTNCDINVKLQLDFFEWKKVWTTTGLYSMVSIKSGVHVALEQILYWKVQLIEAKVGD